MSDLGPTLMLLSVVLAGVAVGVGLYLVIGTVSSEAERVRSRISETQRALRRKDSDGHEGIVGLGMAFMPVMMPIARRLPLEGLKETLAERYAQAGWPGGLADDEVYALSLLLGLALALPVCVVFMAIHPLASIFGLLVVIAGPGLVSSSLSSQGQARDKAIDRTMPFVLDLLTLTIRAGASLNIAMQRVTMDYAKHPIGEEFRSMLMDIEMGSTTKQAFTNFSQRVRCPL